MRKIKQRAILLLNCLRCLLDTDEARNISRKRLGRQGMAITKLKLTAYMNEIRM